MRTAIGVLSALLACACGAPQSRDIRPEPGEEPIETASLPDEEVVPLEPDSTPHRAPAKERPCAWARAWSDSATPDPLLAGIGGAPIPERVDTNPVRLPRRPSSHAGAISIEMVVLPDGSVAEAVVVSRTDPPWPEGERAALDAVKSWRYQPPLLGGTPIAVCTSISIKS